MAFPVVLGTATGSQGNVGTSRSAPLPAGIVAGNLLLLFIWTGESVLSAQNPTPTGWSLLKVMSHTLEAHWLYLYYKKAAGTEGASQAYSITGGTNQTRTIAYRITGHADPDAQPPQASAGAQSLLPDTSPNPDSLTPTGGARDYLWLALCGGGNNSDALVVTAFPASYVNGIQSAAPRHAAAQRQLNAASENPGAFALADGLLGAREWSAFTVAVYPAPTPPPTGTLAAQQQRLVLL